MKRILLALLFLAFWATDAFAEFIIYEDEATAARRRFLIYLVDATDGTTPETGVTISGADAKVSKNGAAEANFGGTLTELATGSYYYEASSGEVDTPGFLEFKLAKAGVRTFVKEIQIMPAVTVQNIVDGVLNEPISGHTTAGTVGDVFNDTATYIAATTAGLIADAVLDELLSGHTTAGTLGKAVGDINTNAVAILDDTGTSGVVIATGGITSAKFAAGAIDAAAIATDAIGAAEIATDAITAAKIAADAITASEIATGAIDATALAAGAVNTSAIAANAITATGIATDAITAAKIAASAIAASEFDQTAADKVWLTTSRSLTGTQTIDIVGNITGNVSGSVGSVTGAVGSVTGNVGGNVTGSIGTLTTAALAQFFTANSGQTYGTSVAGSIVQEIADNSGGSGVCPTVPDIVDGVLDELLAGHSTPGSVGAGIAACSTGGGGESSYRLW